MKPVRSVLSILAFLGMATAVPAQVKVGVITSLSGPGSSIGIPYGKGAAAGQLVRKEAGGQTLELIQLDDGSDPDAATRAARKLIEDNKVDVLIGTATAASSNAIAVVANERKIPYLAVAPINPARAASGERWALGVNQPPSLMIKVVVDRIQRDGAKKIGFIGFSDAWGDMVFNGAKEGEARGAINLVANERYARADTSVRAQVLKLMATEPEAILFGGAATQGALPMIELAGRGYKGKLYGTPALINPDFIRVGGKAVEGVLVSGSPGLVAEQLPEGHYAKAPTAMFRAAYEKLNGSAPTDGFAPVAFDAWLLVSDAVQRVAGAAKPGTPEYRTALRDALFSTKNVAGTGGLFNFTQESAYGVDERALVLMRLVNGAWKFEP